MKKAMNLVLEEEDVIELSSVYHCSRTANFSIGEQR